MAITKLSVDLRAGAMEAQINLQEVDGNDLVGKLIDSLKSTLRERRLGTEFVGRIRKTEGDNSGWVSFPERWAVEEAEVLLDSMKRVRRTLDPPDQQVSFDQAPDSHAKLEHPAEPMPKGITLAFLEKTVSSVDRSGWISQLKSSGSSLSQLLAQHGISTDEQYLELESGLPATQRISLAKVRFEHGLSEAHNPDVPGELDLQVLSVFAPPWLDSIPMHLKGFPKRGRNCLNAAGIKHFSELAELGLESMLRIPKFGRLTYEQIARTLVDDLLPQASAALNPEPSKGPAGESASSRDNPDFSNFTAVWEAVSALVDRESDVEVLRRRIGFGTDAGPETLEMAGKPMDVCRERVRQIQKRAVDRLHDSAGFGRVKASLEAEIERQIAWSRAPVKLGDECTVRALRDASFETIKAFFQLILRSDFKVLIANEGDGSQSARILCGVGEDELKDALRQLEGFITANDGEPRSRFMPLVQEFIQSSFDESIHSDLKAFVEEWINWDYAADPKIISFGDSIEAAAAAVLERSSRPLRLPELIEIAQKEFGLDQSENSIRNMVNNLCVQPGRRVRKDVCVSVFQMGRSEFGTKRHLPIDPDELGHLIPTLRKIMIAGRDCLIPEQPYQWHTSCLWDELRKHLPDNELVELSEGDQWRAVDWLLRYHEPEGVVNLKKGRWVREMQGVDQVARTRDEAILWLLENHFSDQRASRADMEKSFLRVQSPGVGNTAISGQSRVKFNSKEYWLES